MTLNKYLEKHFFRITSKSESLKNDFHDYENFKKFINDHYSLDHLKNHNYIKYVKVIRQIIRINDELKYNDLINKINSIIYLLSMNNNFPRLAIKKYLYKINTIYNLIDLKRIKLINNIKNMKELYIRDSHKFKCSMNMMKTINILNYRYIIFKKYSKQLIHCLDELIQLEKSYGIDHKLIDINNLERKYLGKKSEYIVTKYINEYINLENNNHNIKNNNIKNNNQNKEYIKQKTYYYETNIDLLKLLSIKAIHNKSIKGEIDIMIISYDGSDYIIEQFIEVKSSIKATYEDIEKFLFLQEIIHTMDFEEHIMYGTYIFTKYSFKNIMNKPLYEWTTYICINNNQYNIVEKSHFFFTTVLKIIDDRFIENYYVKNNEDSIMDKYNIILKNKLYIESLFNKWKENVNFENECNIFILEQ
jgi:hypothetical protein